MRWTDGRTGLVTFQRSNRSPKCSELSAFANWLPTRHRSDADATRLVANGFIVTRQAVERAQQLKLFSVYNDSQPRKVILVVTDADMNTMLDMKCNGTSPMRYVQRLYRQFRTAVQ